MKLIGDQPLLTSPRRKATRRDATLGPGLSGTAVACAILATAASWLVTPTHAAAQSVDLDFAVEQALTSVDGMTSPTGYRVGLAFPGVFGPVGFDAGYRSVSEYLGEHPERCGMDACTPGPFDAVMRMRAATFGTSLSRMMNPFVELSLGLTATLTWQDAEFGGVHGTASEGSPPITETSGPDLGGGAFVTWRFPPLLSVLRPFLYARAEWISGGACAADASCFGRRYLGSGGIGLHARIP